MSDIDFTETDVDETSDTSLVREVANAVLLSAASTAGAFLAVAAVTYAFEGGRKFIDRRKSRKLAVEEAPEPEA